MHNPVRVELTRAERPADDQTITDRAHTAQRLAELGHIDASTGEVNGTVSAGWLARINGGDPVEVLDYAVSPGGEGSNVALNLVLTVDALSIGDPSLSQGQPQVRPAAPEQPSVHVWGTSGNPDPRESIPGWQPESTPAVKVHLNPVVMEPGAGDRLISEVREAIARRGGAAGMRA